MTVQSNRSLLPATETFWGFFGPPTSSQVVPGLTRPLSTLPVTTVPVPLMEYTDSMGMANLSASDRFGEAFESSSSTNFKIASFPIASFSPFKAQSAEPRTNGTVDAQNRKIFFKSTGCIYFITFHPMDFICIE